jgi:hypothetical protein
LGPFGFKFSAEKNGDPKYIGGGTDLQKVYISVPISAPGQNSMSKKNIKISITGRTLQHLIKNVTPRKEYSKKTNKNPLNCKVLGSRIS